MFDQYRIYIGIAMAVGLFAWQFWPALSALVAKVRTSATSAVTTGPALASDDDAADFQALKRLRLRFERLKCKDGQAAVDTALAHFFHAEG